MSLNLVYFAALTAHGCLVVFAVDPQDEEERKEQRLAIIADHLGFSWTGESHLMKLSNLKYTLLLNFCSQPLEKHNFKYCKYIMGSS